MSICIVEAELTLVGDERTYEGVMCIATIDKNTNKVISIKYKGAGSITEKETKDYVEQQGAPGTADYFLNEMKEMLEEKNKNPNTGAIWYGWEDLEEIE